MHLARIIVGLFIVCQSQAEERLLIGVASNFTDALEPIAAAFAEANSVDVQISSGSSGKLFAQIQNGAPFDVFLSADKDRAQRVVDAGMSVENTTRRYATGKLMVWSADPGLHESSCFEEFARDATARIAIANPRTAPYGAAALEVLRATFSHESVEARLITGENIAQAAQFAAQGGARFGLLAWSQRNRLPTTGCHELIAADAHAPIEQHAVALIGSSEKRAVEFLDFLQTDAVPLIEAAGYRVNTGE